MSGALRCKCPLNAVVVHRKCNYSAFSGYHYTPSDYSCLRCMTCGHYWRTKAAYVDRLRDATEEQAHGVMLGAKKS